MEKKDVAENARDAEVGPVHDNAKDRAHDKEICSNKQIERVRLLPPSDGTCGEIGRPNFCGPD